MDRRTFNYSLKNIPIPSEKSYKLKLIEKVEQVIKRMRWKAHFFDSKDKDKDQGMAVNYGFKSRMCPPQVKDMIRFEDDLYQMIKKVEFKRVNNEFLNTLKSDIQDIKKSQNLCVFADKTRNIYEMSKESYNKLLAENITKSYKKTDDESCITVNREAKEIATKLGIAQRVNRIAEKPAFITLKDHKDNFENSPKCRLLNPAKSELGKVSKVITEKLISGIKTNTNLQQWKNTSDVINWFTSIENKNLCKFIQFDIVDFYPSISDELFNKAVDYAKQFTDISASEYDILIHCKKSFLFDGQSIWKKNGASEEFDVTMGSFDGAETCELVGLFILNMLSSIIDVENVGLYRDDGLAILRNANGHVADKRRKEIIREFKKVGLNITIQVNLNIVNFLDVTFDLHSGTYKPYHKPNETPMYINVNSNHPQNIIKQLPKTINKRINEISSDEEVFNKSANFYNDALKASGYEESLTFEAKTNNNVPSRRKRKRKIIWFNPPYSVNVKSNIGRKFLNLIDKHFQNHRYSKIFNRNNVKVSYSCMPDVKASITSHNAKLLNPPDTAKNVRKCNCRNKETCPLMGNCLMKEVVYRATITNSVKPTANYIGMTEGPFKGRERQHDNSFKNVKKKLASNLAAYMWKDKDTGGEQSKIQWSIIDRAPSYRNGSRYCRLCLTEKYHIIFQPFQKINKRNEIVSKCRHENKFLLSNFKL